MAEQRLIDTQFVEVLPPLPPPPLPLWVWVVTGLVGIALAGLAWWVWQRQPRARALRQLHRCEKQLRARAAPRRIAAQVFHVVQQVACTVPTRALWHDDAAWQTLHQQIVQCVFHPAAPAPEDLQQLLAQTRSWLRRR